MKGLPFIKSYAAKDYNGEAQNWGFIQNSDGVMFIANTIGYLEYDGVNWRQFKPDNDGVPLSFTHDLEGNIFTGGTGHIGQLKPDSLGQMVYESLTDHLPEDFFIDFVWSTHYFQGKTYFPNKENIVAWDGTEMKIIESPDNIEIMVINNNHLYVDTKSGLYELVKDTLVSLSWADDLSGFTIRVINELSPDSLLIGTYSHGLFLVLKGELFPLVTPLSDFFKTNFLFSSMMLPDGKIILGTAKAGAIILNKDLSLYS